MVGRLVWPDLSTAHLQSPLAPKADVFTAGVPERLVSLLGAPMSNIPEAAASIIASCCEAQEQASGGEGRGKGSGKRRVGR